MNKRIYIDICNEVGKRSNIINDIIPYSLENLVYEHQRVGVDLSLIASSMAKTYSVFLGNEEVINYSLQNANVLPLATLYPGMEYDINNLEEYLENLVKSNVKGIKLDLFKMFIFNRHFLGNIFKFAGNYNLPIIIDWEDIEDKNKFFDVALEYPNTKLIIININWSFKKYIFEYMRQNNNIFIGTNSFIYNGMLEEICNLFSSKRILFSSGYPYYDIGAMKSMIEYANISENEKDDIAYKNAKKLFTISNISKKNYELNDEIAKTVDKGLNLKENLSFPIIDAHTHFVSDKAICADWLGNGKDLNSLLSTVKKTGVSAIVTSPMDGLLFDGIIGNKVLDNALKNNGCTIYGLVTANPYYEEDRKLASKKLEDSAIVGIKLYPSKNWYPYDGKLYENLLNKTASLNKYFLLHGTPEEAERVLKKYPNLKIVLAHSSQSYAFMDKVINLMSIYPNLYIDICNRYLTNKAIEYLIRNVDSKRILFGSDCNLLSESAHLGWIAYSEISYNEKKDILSDNFQRLVRKKAPNEK